MLRSLRRIDSLINHMMMISASKLEMDSMLGTVVKFMEKPTAILLMVTRKTSINAAHALVMR